MLKVRRIFQVAGVVLLGLMFAAALLEGALRLWGRVSHFSKQRRNLAAVSGSGTFRILCVGDSTTYNQYPLFLAEALERRVPGTQFAVIDKGRVGADSLAVAAALTAQIAEFHPHVVVAMTGANDGASYEVDSAKMRLPYVPPFFSRLKIYRLAYYALHGDMFGAPQKPANDLGQPSCAEKGPGSGDWAALCEKYSSEAPNQKAFLAAIDGLEKSASPDPIGYRVCGLAAAFSYGMADRGQKLLDKALALKPDGLENNVGALKFYLLARADSATAAMHEAAALRALSPLTDPKRKASAFVGLAAAFNSAGQIAKARAYYLKAAAEYRGSSSAYSGLCMTYTSSAGDRKEFLKMLPDLERSFPDGPAGLRVCGQSAANNWRLFDVAERLMSAAIRAFPADSESRFALADFYRKWRHDQPKAEGMLSSVLSAEPGSVHAAAELELSKGGNKAVPRERSVAYSPSAIANYRRMADLLSSRGIVFLAMQYPMRSAVPLKEALEGRSGAVIVGNENFARYVSEKGYAAYFRDMYAGDFGHCTDAGNRLIAENVARILAEQVLPPSGRRN